MKRRAYLVIMLIFTILIGLSTMASAEEAAHSGQWEFDGAIHTGGVRRSAARRAPGVTLTLVSTIFSATLNWDSWERSGHARANGL